MAPTATANRFAHPRPGKQLDHTSASPGPATQDQADQELDHQHQRRDTIASDSGKSSSAESASTSGDSMGADHSLEPTTAPEAVTKKPDSEAQSVEFPSPPPTPPRPAADGQPDEHAEIIKNYMSDYKLPSSGKHEVSNESDVSPSPVNTSPEDLTQARPQTPETAEQDQAPKSPTLKSALASSNNNDESITTSSENIANNNNNNNNIINDINEHSKVQHHDDDLENSRTAAEQSAQLNNESLPVEEETLEHSSPQKSPVANGVPTTQANANNNYCGLNLNMTASEMRELLASRKKFDPKKAQMNIRQKYEIIQQM